MNPLDGLISGYTEKHDKKIKAICRPLNDHLQIPYFSYYQFDETGKFCFLSNYAEPADFYYSEKLFEHNPFFVHPDLLISGTLITSSTLSEEYLKTIEASQRKFQLSHAFLMVEKQGNLVEGFLYGTKIKDPLFSNSYYTNIDLLKKFNRYFVREAAAIIKKMKEDPFNIQQARGAAFLKRDPTLPLSSCDIRTKAFLKSISPLSTREHECLELFRKGHSAQSTAAKLGLSKRTVEHYFDSIKDKLQCSSKRELLNFS